MVVFQTGVKKIFTIYAYFKTSFKVGNKTEWVLKLVLRAWRKL